MKKILLIGIMAALPAIVALGTSYGQPMGPGMMGQGGASGPGYGPSPQAGWYCPWSGRWQGQGWGMCPGMGGGYWRQIGPGYGPQYQQREPLKEKDAKGLLENYLQSTKNPNLKLGKITDKGDSFEGEIVTKENSLVDKILVDKNTGWMRSEY